MTDPAPAGAPAVAKARHSLRTARSNVPRSAAAFLAAVATLVVIKLVLMRIAPSAVATAPGATMLRWGFLGGITVIGLAGVWFAAETGLPESWDPRVPLRERLVLPALVGVAFGVVAVVVDWSTGWSAIATQQGLGAWPPGPSSLSAVLLSAQDATMIVLYYLVPIPTLMWFAMLALRGRWQSRAFWVIGALAATLDAIAGGGVGISGHSGLVAVLFAQNLGLALAQVAAFRRAGIGAAVVLRVASSLVWLALRGSAGGPT